MKRVIRIGICVVLLLLVFYPELDAQCSMCRGTAESGLSDKAEARSLNYGILYLMTIPYILLGSIFFLWWKFKKKSAAKNPAQ